ncbi:MAG: RpiB/LacA/LacB family sugar-phosphate isomerase [Chloroflexi bacterium]|nr:RpiB/LacA/LacB family sugar-phosphate isomerase [Chloroflexota bacterium]
MRVAVGSDEQTSTTDAVVEELRRREAKVELFGALAQGDDTSWPEVARRVAEQVSQGRCSQGLLFCWTGTGVSMAANKVPGARAALCVDAATAAGARRWNDANILCMSLRLTTPALAIEMLEAWFSASPEASEGENIERLKALDAVRAGAR